MNLTSFATFATCIVGGCWLAGCSPSTGPALEAGTASATIDSPAEAEAFVAVATAAAPAADGQLADTTLQRSPAATASSAAGAPEWSRWLGPNGNGASDETGLLRTFPTDGPQVLWRAALGTGFSAIAVAGGRVATLFGAEGREFVVCFDAATGEELWKVDSDEDFAAGRAFGPRAMPVVDAGRVYSVGASGQMLCLDAANGDVIWRVHLVEEHNAPLSDEEGLSSTPLVDGGRLLVQAGRSLYAFDKSSGELLWQALDEPMSHASPAIVTLDGRRQLLVLTAGNLVGLSPEDGREIWRHVQQAVNIANPVVGPGNRIFAGAAYGYGCQLIEVKGASARQVYKNAVLGSHHATPILHAGNLYGFDDRNGIFKCVDFATGEERWEAREVGKGNIVLADGQLIVINEEGELLLAPVSPEGFRPTAQARVLRGTCYTAPSLADGRLYLRSDGELVCISLRD